MTPEQEKLLRDVHTAIVGNEGIGHEGLVSRVSKLEKYKNKVALAVLIGTPVFGVLWAWVQHKYFGI